MDAIKFMEYSDATLPNKTFFCVDPPYFNKGSSLYTNFYQKSDHTSVAQAASKLQHPWVLTYDNVYEIQALYKANRQFAFDINYSLQVKRVSTELLIASKGLKLPQEVRSSQISCPKRRVA